VHLITLVEGLRGRGIGFRSLNEGAIDTTSASGELIFNIFSALAQFERRLIQERTKAGLAVARARVLSDEAKVRAAKKLSADKTITIDDFCKTLKISRSTYYRYLGLRTNNSDQSAGSGMIRRARRLSYLTKKFTIVPITLFMRRAVSAAS